MDVTLFLISSLYVFYTPYIKVEESFNMQATHDILYLKNNFTEYDHHAYPGVVPRTFLGPLFIAIIASPFILLFEQFNFNRFWSQYVVRLILSALVCLAWQKWKSAISKLFGVDVAVWLKLITITQFHFMFYMSRTLPNILVLPIVLLSLSCWLNGQLKSFICLAGIAILIFRSELLIFLGLLLLYNIIQKQITFKSVIRTAIPAALCYLTITALVDSFFWRRVVWPEGEVLWYNTVLNKSSNWGRSPFLWYFYSALPRGLACTFFLIPIGLYVDERIRPITFAALAFIFLYSFLPHKELRFIIYVFPVLNLTAAIACHYFWIRRMKTYWHRFFATCAAGHLLINISVTLLLLWVSGTNYPGGEALQRLNYLESNSSNVAVHINNLAAQTGVTRFLQNNKHWIYSKEEHLNYTKEELKDFTHLLVEAKSKHNAHLWQTLQEDFITLDFVDCFKSINLQSNSFMPLLRIKTKPCIAILKRKEASKEVLDTDVSIQQKQQEQQQHKHQVIQKLKIKSQTRNHKEIDDAQKLEVVQINGNEGNQIKVNDFSKANDYLNQEEYDILDKLNRKSMKEKTESEIDLQDFNQLFLDVQRNHHSTNMKTKKTKRKLRSIIEEYYATKERAKQMAAEEITNEKISISSTKSQVTVDSRKSMKIILKQERIKDMIEDISKMDLKQFCDLERLTTKDCLITIIEKLDKIYKNKS